MHTHRIYNFNPGPAALPLPVLEEIQASFLNYRNSGMSVTEISHRSKWFEDIMADAVGRSKRLLALSDDYSVLFLQGGASLQFSMVPLNFLADGRPADYVDTGTWSTKAIKEAQLLGKSIRVAASSSDRNYAYIPGGIDVNPDAAYVHITSNNTIKGTQWHTFPDTGGVPLIADMSSDIMSKPLDLAPFGLVYAGAQKNLGPAGVCLVIVRRDMLDSASDALPSMLSYRIHVAKNSLYNTPPCFAVHAVQLVLKWLEESMGGLEKMAAVNRQKAQKIYDLIDASQFYHATAEKDSRSVMNVTFRLPSEDLETQFIEKATEQGLGGLKGHRSVGGCRASIYNAVPLAAVETLVDYMKHFEDQYG